MGQQPIFFIIIIKYHMQLARKRKIDDISLKYVVDMSIF